MLDIKTLLICVSELLVYNLILVLMHAWNIVTVSVGTGSVFVTLAIVAVKAVLGFYEGKQISPVWTFRVSNGITLSVILMFVMLLQWRVS